MLKSLTDQIETLLTPFIILIIIAVLTDLVVYHTRLRRAMMMGATRREARAEARDSGRHAAALVMFIGIGIFTLWML